MANGRALAGAGCDVVYTADGEEGLGAARENIPDLNSARYNVAKMSGLEVLRAVKGAALLKYVPDIVLSGLGQANGTKLLNEGAGAFLMKSDTSSENNSLTLIQAVQSLLTEPKPSRVSSVRIRPLLPDLRFWVPGPRK